MSTKPMVTGKLFYFLFYVFPYFLIRPRKAMMQLAGVRPRFWPEFAVLLPGIAFYFTRQMMVPPLYRISTVSVLPVPLRLVLFLALVMLGAYLFTAIVYGVLILIDGGGGYRDMLCVTVLGMWAVMLVFPVCVMLQGVDSSLIWFQNVPMYYAMALMVFGYSGVTDVPGMAKLLVLAATLMAYYLVTMGMALLRLKFTVL